MTNENNRIKFFLYENWARTKTGQHTVPIMQERHKNHIESLNKRSEVKPTENNKRRKPQESTTYDLDMTSRMRRLSCNGSIQSTFKNPPF